MRIGIIPTAEPWALGWSSWLRDHTDTEVSFVADPWTLFDSDWSVLLVDAESMLLSPEIVADATGRGRQVVAVVSPSSKQRAIDAGVGAMVEGDATPAELANVLRAVERELPRRRPVSRPRVHATSRPEGALWVVGGPSAHRARVGIHLARHLGGVLVECDEIAPSVGQRLGLSPTPNLVSAALATRAGEGPQTQSAGKIDVLVGLAEPAQWSVAPARVSRVLGELLAAGPVVSVVGPVCEPGERFGLTSTTLSDASAVLAVGDATPTGVTTLSHWVAGLRRLAPRVPLATLLVGRVSAHQRASLSRSLDGLGPIWFATVTERAERRAEWSGVVPERGDLPRRVRSASETLAHALPS